MKKIFAGIAVMVVLMMVIITSQAGDKPTHVHGFVKAIASNDYDTVITSFASLKEHRGVETDEQMRQEITEYYRKNSGKKGIPDDINNPVDHANRVAEGNEGIAESMRALQDLGFLGDAEQE